MKKHAFYLVMILGLLGLPATAQRRLTTRIQYDGLGQVAGIEYPDGSRVAYAYDNEAGIQSRVVYHPAELLIPLESTTRYPRGLSPWVISQLGLVTSDPGGGVSGDPNSHDFSPE